MLEEKGFFIEINFFIEVGNDVLYCYIDIGDKIDKYF